MKVKESAHEAKKVLSYLQRQAGSDPEALALVQHWRQSNRLDPADDLNIIMREWRGMFSYTPGRRDGLKHIISLVSYLLKCQTEGAKCDLYQHPAWAEICKLRGPADCVMLMEDISTGVRFTSIGVSGFLDMDAYVCRSCGSVLFRSHYNQATMPECECGEAYNQMNEACTPFSPSEGRYECIKTMSPYEYFENHHYRVDEQGWPGRNQ